MAGLGQIIPILLYPFSQPIKDYGYIDKKKPDYVGFWHRFNIDRNFPEIAGRSVVSYFNFDTSNDKELVVKVALSGVSTEGALKNLCAEAGGKSFEQVLMRLLRHGIQNLIYLK